jgi:ribokinase
MGPEVFVVGALHLDVVVDAPHLPSLDETVVGTAVAYRFGGKGGNQAVAAARMGARVAMAGCVGRDRFGGMILAALDAAGVERGQVREVDGASGMSVAIVDAAGDYGAVIVSGVNREIGRVAVPASARVVVLQNEVPEAVNVAVAAGAGGCRVVLNAAPARAVAAELLARVDVLVVNRGEAAALAGTEDPEAAAVALRALGPRVAVVTLGGEGLVAASADGVAAHGRAPGRGGLDPRCGRRLHGRARRAACARGGAGGRARLRARRGGAHGGDAPGPARRSDGRKGAPSCRAYRASR